MKTYSEGWWESVAHYSGKTYTAPPEIEGLIFTRNDLVLFAAFVKERNIEVDDSFLPTEKSKLLNNYIINDWIKWKERGL